MEKIKHDLFSNIDFVCIARNLSSFVRERREKKNRLITKAFICIVK